jgi:hypothetical protein
MSKNKHGHQKGDKTPEQTNLPPSNSSITQEDHSTHIRQTELNKQPQSQKEARMECSTWLKPEVIIGGFGVIAAIVVTIIYACQLQTMQRQLKLSQEAMQTDQRAWVGFYEAIPNRITDQQGRQLFNVFLTIKNTGKTPALNMAIQTLATGKRREEPPPTWEEADAQQREFERRRESTEREIGRPIPGIPVQHDVLAPGAIREKISTFTMAYDAQGIELLKTITRYFLVRVTYNDIFSSETRTTTMCFMYRSLDAVQTCPTGNSMN